MKKPSNEVLKIEDSTNNVIVEVEKMAKKAEIDLRTWRVWGLYSAILSYFSLASDTAVCVSAAFVNRKPFTLGKEYENTPVVSDEDFERVMAALDLLTEKEKTVLVLRFGLDYGTPRTLEEVGKMLGVTRERIRQLEAKALRKMRTPSRLCKLPALFGFVPPAEPESEVDKKVIDINADTDIINLGLSVRAYNCLKRFAHINTIGDILNYPKEDWPKVKNLGHKSTLEIQERMRTVGYPEFSVE